MLAHLLLHIRETVRNRSSARTNARTLSYATRAAHERKKIRATRLRYERMQPVTHNARYHKHACTHRPCLMHAHSLSEFLHESCHTHARMVSHARIQSVPCTHLPNPAHADTLFYAGTHTISHAHAPLTCMHLHRYAHPLTQSNQRTNPHTHIHENYAHTPYKQSHTCAHLVQSHQLPQKSISRRHDLLGGSPT